MENNLEQEKFKVTVPFNNDVMVNGRKKTKIGAGIGCLFGAIFFIILTIFAGVTYGFASFAVMFFMVFDIIFLGVAIFMFCTIKPNAKDTDATIVYSFYNDYLHVNKYKDAHDEKPKTLAVCLYNKYKNKQYVAKFIEDEIKFQIKIFTGTYNGVPQYITHIIPKSVFKQNEELSALKEFLHNVLGSKYTVKQ